MLLYVNDLLAHPKVSAMDDEQFAWYLRMLMRAWVSEPACLLLNKDSELMQAAGCKSARKWAAKKELVLSCWVECDGGKYLTQTRLQLELAKMIKISDKRSEAGKQSGVQRKLTLVEQKGTSVQQKAATQTQTQTQTHIKPRSKPTAEQASADSRFSLVKKHVEKCCEFANVPFTWDGAEATQLSRWLKANPDLPPEGVIELVKARFRGSTKPGERPRKWIGDLGQFANQRNGNGTKAQSNQDATRANITAGINKRLADLGGQGDGLRKGLLRAEPSTDGSDG